MRASTVLRRAAEHISDKPGVPLHNVTCFPAIMNASPTRGAHQRAYDIFMRAFNEVDFKGRYLWANPFRTGRDQEARRLALLFAAEWAKDRERKPREAQS